MWTISWLAGAGAGTTRGATRGSGGGGGFGCGLAIATGAAVGSGRSRRMRSDLTAAGACRLAKGKMRLIARESRPKTEPPKRWTVNDSMSPMSRSRHVRTRLGALIMSWEITFLGLPKSRQIQRRG
jgi:hypothetical protein